MTMRQFSRHALFASLDHIDGSAAYALTTSVADVSDLNKGDFIFEEGTPGDTMYFLAYGQMRYHPGPVVSDAHFPFACHLVLEHGAWFSEAALWTMWVHAGSMEALVTTELISVSAPHFQAELRRYPEVANIITKYGVTFHRLVSEPGVVRTDLAFPIDYQ